MTNFLQFFITDIIFLYLLDEENLLVSYPVSSGLQSLQFFFRINWGHFFVSPFCLLGFSIFLQLLILCCKVHQKMPDRVGGYIEPQKCEKNNLIF